jgi:CheY-like chemotaxis protein
MLTVILGNTDNALAKLSEQDPMHKRLESIKSAAQRSANLTRQLLAFARKQTIDPQVLDLNDTVPSMLKMLQRLIGEDIELVWVPGHDLWKVKIDPSQIDQILANLLVNARDAIEGIGKVTIETASRVLDDASCAGHAGLVPGEYVLLTLSDTGAGMSKETLDHIFEPFFTTKAVGEGTGLGLATVYGIVKQNGGFIDIYSESGTGTILKIYLPRHVGEGTEASLEPVIELPEGRGETVLLAEDEIAVLEISKRNLEGLGYTVLGAQTPGEAIRQAGAHAGEIHMLLTDMVMPGMNGRELAARIQAIRPGLKVLFMSGYTADTIAHDGILDKGVQFIQKPFTLLDLACKVRKTLEQESNEPQRTR